MERPDKFSTPLFKLSGNPELFFLSCKGVCLCWLNDVAKDIQKNEKAQTDIKRQIQALNNQGGQSLKDELKMLNIKEESLAKAQSKIAKMESDKRLGKKIDEEAYQQAQQTVVKKQEQK